jgi:hypothetical protein
MEKAIQTFFSQFLNLSLSQHSQRVIFVGNSDIKKRNESFLNFELRNRDMNEFMLLLKISLF